jgi:hypothetical protein
MVQRALMSKSKMTKMLFTFFDIKGIVHFEFIPQGSVNQVHHVKISSYRKLSLEKAGDLAHPPLYCSCSQDPVKQFLTQKSITEMIWLRMTSALKGMNISRILKIFKEM